MFIVKKVALAIATCSVMALSAPSMAGTLVFTGAVTSSTCDIQPVSSAGAVTPEIQLGNLAPDTSSALPTAVAFSLAPVNASACSSPKADITWTSANLIQTGLANTGTATGVHIELMPKSTGNPIDGASPVSVDTAIKGGLNTVKYVAATTGENANKLVGSFDYTAQLVRDAGGVTPTAGSVSSMVTYTVAYY